MNKSAKNLLERLNTTTVKLTSASLALSALGLTFTVMSQSSTEDLSTQACVCDSDTSYNTSLPSSHPSNRCATQGDDVSWGKWLTGNSRSTQFHFIDLLELLHSRNSEPVSDLPSSNNADHLKG
ncbi:hypothetical protein [Shewanella maritima]|uniref:hypothetical protein n=1 Tax=Shewanella maritima TaxID=2520507 RepID=UPI003736F3E3